MRDAVTFRLRGAEYLGTVVGPPAVPHAGGEIRVTSIDRYSAGLHVHLYFWLLPQTTFTPADRKLARRRLLADWPECPRDQVDLFAELKWLGARVRSCRTSDDVGTEYVSVDGGGQYLERRAVLTDVMIYPHPPNGRCTMRWGRTTLQLDLRVPGTTR
jgi:hypothetical protein